MPVIDDKGKFCKNLQLADTGVTTGSFAMRGSGTSIASWAGPAADGGGHATPTPRRDRRHHRRDACIGARNGSA
ncbi:hypothetical protein ACQP2P_23330 [Dactylosporangium sp. CA-139114]|uniref:hypothetical protein n=1 Tax=Dactylosporangium sp. CA-139114 TaxID=3239931 RepID=UPI003D9804E3